MLFHHDRVQENKFIFDDLFLRIMAKSWKNVRLLFLQF